MRLIIAIAAGAALLAACSPATQDTADAPEADAAAAAPQGASQLAAAAGTNCEAPAPTAVAVTGEMTREGQLALLAHPDPKLAANKRLVWDMWRTLLNGYHIDRAGEFIHPDYIQHNPMANTGLAGMQGFFRSLGRQAREIPEAIPEGVVAVMAEGDLVTVAFPRGGTDSCGRQFVSTWFDMFRIKDGLILELWDAAARP
jgi:predicted SnoaL-like aldol condensation-catalyzing enzyme